MIELIKKNCFTILIAFGFATHIVSCKNAEQLPQKGKTSEESDTIKSLITVPDKLNVLYLTESQFRSLIGTDMPNEVDGKLSFQFALPGSNSTDNLNRLTLAAWPSKRGRYNNVKKEYLQNEVLTEELILNKKDIFGGQKLINSDVQKILVLLNAPGSPNNKVVAFKPKKDGNKISYLIAVFTSLAAFKTSALWPQPSIAETNPSPPAGDDPNNNQ